MAQQIIEQACPHGQLAPLWGDGTDAHRQSRKFFEYRDQPAAQVLTDLPH
jgi:hypothetical protein